MAHPEWSDKGEFKSFDFDQKCPKVFDFVQFLF